MDTRDIDHIGISFAGCGVGMSDTNKEEYSKVFGHAKEWYSGLSEDDADRINMRILEKRCRDYITPKVKPVGFVSSFIWLFVGKIILNYIIGKLMDYLKSRRA